MEDSCHGDTDGRSHRSRQHRHILSLQVITLHSYLTTQSLLYQSKDCFHTDMFDTTV